MPARRIFSRPIDISSLRHLLKAETLDILGKAELPPSARPIPPPDIAIDPANPPLMPPRSVFERQGRPIGMNLKRTDIPGRDVESYVEPLQDIDQTAFTGVARPEAPPLDEAALQLRADRLADVDAPRQPMLPSHLVDKHTPSTEKILYGSGELPDIEELYRQDPWFEHGQWVEDDLRHRDEMEARLAELLRHDPEQWNARAKKRGTPTWEQLHQRATNSYGAQGDALFAPLLPEKKPVNTPAYKDDPTTFRKVVARAKNFARKVGFDYPKGKYFKSDIPGGKRSRFEPAESASDVIADLETDNAPGYHPPTLQEIARGVGDATGEGQTQGHMRTGVKMPQDVEEHTWWIAQQTGIDERELQTVWDRIHGNYFMDEPAAQAKIHDWLNSIQEVVDKAEASGRDPVRAAQAHYAKTRGLLPGVPGEGHFEQVAAEDTGHNRAQLEEFGDTGFEQGSGFTGDEFDSAQREEHTRGTKRVTDVSDKWLVGQQPLEAVRWRGGQVSPNQVENIRSGVGDLMLVPRGAIKETGPLRLGAKKPFDVNVLDVRPLHPGMEQGFLEDVSRRSKVPLRTLRTLVDAADFDPRVQYDLVHVQADPKKPFTALVPEGRRKLPDQLGFWNSEKGEAAKARLFRYPRILEILLSKPGARVTSNTNAPGDVILGVYFDKKQPIGLKAGKNGEPVPVKLRYDPISKSLFYGETAFQPNSLEAKEFVREFAVKNPHVTDIQPGPAEVGDVGYRLDAERFDRDQATQAANRDYLATGMEADTKATPGEQSRSIITGIADISSGEVRTPHLYGVSQANRSGPFITQDGPIRTLRGELVEGERAADLLNSGSMANIPLQEERSPEGVRLPRDPKKLDTRLKFGEQAGPRVPFVKGLALSLTPLRRNFSPPSKDNPTGVRFLLAKTPKLFGRTTKLVAGVPSKLRQLRIAPKLKKGELPELTVVFTQRTPGSKVGEFSTIARKEDRELARTLVNPTADELRGVLGHSDVRNVIVRVEEGSQRGPAENLWNRVHSIIDDVQQPGEHELLGRLGPEATTRERVLASARPRGFEADPPPGYAWPSMALSRRQSSQMQKLTALAMRSKDPAYRAALLKKIGLVKVPETDPRALDNLMFAESGHTSTLADAGKVKKGVDAESPQDIGTSPERPIREPFENTQAQIEAQRAAPKRKSNWLADAFEEHWMKALGLGTVAAGHELFSDDKAEAAPRSLSAGKKIAAALRGFEHPETYKPSLTKQFQTAATNYLTPIYDTLTQQGKKAEAEALRQGTAGQEGLQVLSGSLGRRAEQAYEEARLARQTMDDRGLTDDLTQLMSINQDLRRWDMAARKRDKLFTDALVAETTGQDQLAMKLREKAQALDDNIANREVVADGKSKEDLVAELQAFHAAHGPQVYQEMKEVEAANFRAVEAAVRKLHAKGLLADESFKELEARGFDHIPAWLTEFQVDPDTNQVRWTGGVPFEEHTTSIKGTTEQLIDEAMGSKNITKDPLSNAARFVTLAEAEVTRNDMAEAVVQAFGAPEINRELATKAGLGNTHYTHMRKGVPVTHELPTQVVNSLLFADQEFVNRYLTYMPNAAAQTISTFRGLSEAGSTLLSTAWAAKQVLTHDPAAAVFQLPSKGGLLKQRGFSRLPRYYRDLIVNMGMNLASELRTGKSSAARKAAIDRGVLYGGVAGDFQDMASVEGRDVEGALGKAFNEGQVGKVLSLGTQKLLGKFANISARPFDDAQKIASMQMMDREAARDAAAGITPFSQEEINYHVRVSGGSPDMGQKGAADQLVRQFPFARTTLIANENALRNSMHYPKKFMKHFVTFVAIEGAREAFNEKTAEELGMPLDEVKGRFSEYDLDNTFLVMIPPSWAKQLTKDGSSYEVGANGIARPYALKWAYPPIVSQIMAPAKGMAKALRTGDPTDMVSSTIDPFLPGSVPLELNSVPNALKSGGRRVLAAAPNWARLPLEQAINVQGFTGAPVVGSRIEGLSAEDEFGTGTEPFYKELGRVTGMSPSRMQHIGKGMLPGALNWPIGIINAMQPAEVGRNGQPIPEVERSLFEKGQRIPGPIGDLVKMVTPQRYERDLGQHQNDFYGLRQQTKAAATAWKEWQEGLRTEEPSPMTKAMAAANPSVSRMVLALAKNAKEQEFVRMAPNLTGQQKQQRIQLLINQKREMLRTFLETGPYPALVAGDVPAQIGVPQSIAVP